AAEVEHDTASDPATALPPGEKAEHVGRKTKLHVRGEGADDPLFVQLLIRDLVPRGCFASLRHVARLEVGLGFATEESAVQVRLRRVLDDLRTVVRLEQRRTRGG